MRIDYISFTISYYSISCLTRNHSYCDGIRRVEHVKDYFWKFFCDIDKYIHIDCCLKCTIFVCKSSNLYVSLISGFLQHAYSKAIIHVLLIYLNILSLFLHFPSPSFPWYLSTSITIYHHYQHHLLHVSSTDFSVPDLVNNFRFILFWLASYLTLTFLPLE